MPPDKTNLPQPSLPQPITDVPQANVGQIVQRFLDFDDVKKLHVKIQANGKFTVSPRSPDSTKV